MNNSKKITFVALAGATALGLNSCGKYEDGPNFSLLTKKARVAGDWDVKSMGSEVLTAEYGISFNFEKDGSMKYNYTANGTVQDSYSGSWDFTSDKEELVLTVDGESIVFDIKRLTNSEMWLDDDASDADGNLWKLEAK